MSGAARTQRRRVPAILVAVVVAATMVPALAAPTTAHEGHVFPDVPIDHRFRADISWLAAMNATHGYADGTFRPTAPLSRQAMVQILMLLSGHHHDHGGAGAAPTTFPDVPPDSPFVDAITWAVDEGVVTGYPDGLFRPSAPVSRQAMVAMLHRLSGITRTHPPATFLDVGPDHRFATAIAFGDATNLVDAHHEGRFGGDLPLSRQAGAAQLHRFWQMTGGSWPVHAGHGTPEPCTPTAAEQAAADQLVVDVKASLARWPSVAEVEAAGYIPVAPPFGGAGAHWLQPTFVNDGNIVDPLRPELVMIDGDGSVQGAMFLMDRPGDPGPLVGGCLTPWHAHDNLCADGPLTTGGQIVGFTSWGCPTGTMLHVTPEMLHVWQIPRPGGPFEPLET